MTVLERLKQLQANKSKDHQSNEDCVKAGTSWLVMRERRKTKASTGELAGQLIVADCGMYECFECGRVQWVFKPETAVVIHD